jgi:NAD(P)-dependent dehydrogenase (short-subunit alcohol dehydrogenase family)
MPTTIPKTRQRPPQQQARQPGHEEALRPQPAHEPQPASRRRLEGRVALISGGDSGIGRAVARAFAAEGADVGILYLEEHRDAEETVALVEAEGRRAFCLAGDIGSASFCKKAVQRAVKELGQLDILVNNAAEQHPCDSLEGISEEQLERTFRTNVFAMFHLTRSALAHLGAGAAIVNTASVVAYRGSAHLLDYAATKGAIVAFTRSLALTLAERKIRVNAVAPGPIWTPLIAASFSADEVATFGSNTPLRRAGEPVEVAPAYVYLASDESSYVTGQVMHVNGGEVVNG